MRVYVVTSGELGEGGNVLGVYKSQSLAVKKALKEPTRAGYGWEKDKIIDGKDDRWINGCDFVKVESFKLVERG